jgi:beta-phosphoglucomutase-like phosphatase (HAD superfamily)
METKRGIIFDMDGVLVDAMPFHCKAIQMAAKQEANVDVDQRDVYLLEGMPGEDMVKEVLRRKGYSDNKKEYHNNDDSVDDNLRSLAHKIHERKKKIFEQINVSSPIAGAKELISTIQCKKALVSGAAKQEVNSIIDKHFGRESFDVIITGEDLEEGKPSADPFRTALTKLGLRASEAIIVENAPLGVKAANNAGIKCIVTLNNTPLKVPDFDGLILRESIFPDTKSAGLFLKQYCQNLS